MKSRVEEKERVAEFKRNIQLENLLATLNQTLWSAEKQLLEKLSTAGQDYPIIFVMGPLRSGTTLFIQWLAQTGLIAYPTNLLARFYGAPIVGAHIQLLLTDERFKFRDEITEFNSPVIFSSENGKTKGALAPNEFWYFWRRFLPFKELDWLPDEDLFRLVDKHTLVAELTALTRIFCKPFALKSMILNYNIPFLDAIFKKKLFVQIKRDPVTNVASILDARKRQFGNEKKWYSFKIPEYHDLKNLEPVVQCAGQIYYINRAVTKGMSKLNYNNKLEIQYEEFCMNPFGVYQQLMEKLQIEVTGVDYHGPDYFEKSRNVERHKRETIKRAIAMFHR